MKIRSLACAAISVGSVTAAGAAGIDTTDPGLARARAVTGLCALSSGQRPRAETLAAQARQAFAVQPDVSPYFKAPLKELDRRLGGAPRS